MQMSDVLPFVLEGGGGGTPPALVHTIQLARAAMISRGRLHFLRRKDIQMMRTTLYSGVTVDPSLLMCDQELKRSVYVDVRRKLTLLTNDEPLFEYIIKEPTYSKTFPLSKTTTLWNPPHDAHGHSSHVGYVPPSWLASLTSLLFKAAPGTAAQPQLRYNLGGSVISATSHSHGDIAGVSVPVQV